MSHFDWGERQRERVGIAKTSLCSLARSSSWPQEQARAVNLTFFPASGTLSLSLSPTNRHRQVVARDYPRPDIDNSGPFVEAAQLSSSLAAAMRPAKPLKVVIAGAGKLGIVWFPFFGSN